MLSISYFVFRVVKISIGSTQSTSLVNSPQVQRTETATVAAATQRLRPIESIGFGPEQAVPLSTPKSHLHNNHIATPTTATTASKSTAAATKSTTSPLPQTPTVTYQVGNVVSRLKSWIKKTPSNNVVDSPTSSSSRANLSGIMNGKKTHKRAKINVVSKPISYLHSIIAEYKNTTVELSN